jgi:hypothetical protein
LIQYFILHISISPCSRFGSEEGGEAILGDKHGTIMGRVCPRTDREWPANPARTGPFGAGAK